MLILYFISAAASTVTTKSTTMKPTSKKLNVCIFNSIETVVKCLFYRSCIDCEPKIGKFLASIQGKFECCQNNITSNLLQIIFFYTLARQSIISSTTRLRMKCFARIFLPKRMQLLRNTTAIQRPRTKWLTISSPLW